MEPSPRKLFDRVRDATHLKNYSLRTEKTYVGWIERFTHFHKLRHPVEMNTPESEAFLIYLVVQQTMALSTLSYPSNNPGKSA
jgi:hypothetical protein